MLLGDRARHVGATSAAAQLPTLGKLLARGVAFDAPNGEAAQLKRLIQTHPAQWPAAAMGLAIDAPQIRHGTWLRADPAHVRADAMTGRVMAIGNLGLDANELGDVSALLTPWFAAQGFKFLPAHPERWYLRVPDAMALPQFAPPEAVLGADLRHLLPEGDAGRVWRQLLNESQMLLHHAAFNQARHRRGAIALNSLWFWGAARLPVELGIAAARVATSDPLLEGAIRLAGIEPVSYAQAAPCGPDSSAIDLRGLDDLDALEADWLRPDFRALQRRRIDALSVSFSDGSGVTLDPWQAWRVWRRARQ